MNKSKIGFLERHVKQKNLLRRSKQTQNQGQTYPSISLVLLIQVGRNDLCDYRTNFQLVCLSFEKINQNARFLLNQVNFNVIWAMENCLAYSNITWTPCNTIIKRVIVWVIVVEKWPHSSSTNSLYHAYLSWW